MKKKRLRVLVLMHPDLVPPDSLQGYTEQQIYDWKTEYDIVTALRKLGHEVRPLGVADELRPIREAITEWRPHIVFNLLEEFHGIAEFDQHVVSYLELMKTRYTGCNPRGLVLARDKALSKKVLIYHRVRVPGFMVVPRGRRARKTKALEFPLIVKSLTEEASLGISQASVVDSEDKLAERVEFVHDNIGTDAIVEEFVEGRELYVGVLGNKRIQVLPVWELVFENLAPGAPAIATASVKHNTDYQKKRGIYQQPAEDLPEALQERIVRLCKRIYRTLNLDGYARIDYRLREDGRIYFLEANPNPEISEREEFAQAALAAGYSYRKLIAKILDLGLKRGR